MNEYQIVITRTVIVRGHVFVNKIGCTTDAWLVVQIGNNKPEIFGASFNHERHKASSIQAVKYIRDETGCSLLDAKRAHDGISHERGGW